MCHHKQHTLYQTQQVVSYVDGGSVSPVGGRVVVRRSSSDSRVSLLPSDPEPSSKIVEVIVSAVSEIPSSPPEIMSLPSSSLNVVIIVVFGGAGSIGCA